MGVEINATLRSELREVMKIRQEINKGRVWIHTVFVGDSTAEINTMAKSNLGKKGLISPSTLYGCYWRKLGKNQQVGTGGRNKPWRNTAYWLTHCGLFSLLHYTPRVTCLGVESPTVGWALPYQSLIKTNQDLQASLMETFFSTVVPSSQITLASVKLI